MMQIQRIIPPGRPLPVNAMLDANYIAAFELSGVDATHSPLEWARATFETPPWWLGWFVWLGWKYVLGLQLEPKSAVNSVHGWPISDENAQSLTLDADASLLRAQNIVVAGKHDVTWLTLVRYERPLGRVLWNAAALIHHRTLPYLLKRAGNQLS